MKNKLAIIPLLSAFCLPANAEQTCQAKSDLLGAHYQVTQSLITGKLSTGKSDLTADSKEISIWRTKQKILTVNDEQSTTWFKLRNGSVQKTAHFDHFKRSIEYSAKPMADKRWQQLRQLITNSQRQSLYLIGSNQEGCWQQETYQWKNDKTAVVGELVWNANLQLVTSLIITQGDQQKNWQLNSIEQDESAIAQAFTQRANYQSTDFADIGDNESDPFLIKMINLGFVEHGASGFYNTQGENMSAAHHH